MEKGVPSTWYVGIDQHKRYLTICVRDERGDVVQRRQVKTAWVEVMRRLCEALWHMLSKQEAYRPVGQAGASATVVDG